MQPAEALVSNRVAIRRVVESHRARNARVFGSVLRVLPPVQIRVYSLPRTRFCVERDDEVQMAPRGAICLLRVFFGTSVQNGSSGSNSGGEASGTSWSRQACCT